MTAEIVIMNKEAIAIAADSAVTIRMQKKGREKIFPSANKLFTLSKYHPIGIMIYGNTMIMGIPWETIIKSYRKKLGSTRFDELEEYAVDFISFIDRNSILFPDKLQENFTRTHIISYFNFIRKRIIETVEQKISQEGSISIEQSINIINSEIQKHNRIWSSASLLPHLEDNFYEAFFNKYDQLIQKATKEVFSNLPINDDGLKDLKSIAVSLFSRFPEQITKDDISGVVITGFGENDIFPKLSHYIIEGVTINRLIYSIKLQRKIDQDTTAWIMPFAQKEMVSTFVEGIDPDLKRNIYKYLNEILDQYPSIICNNMANLDSSSKLHLIDNIKSNNKKLITEFDKGFAKYIDKIHISPIMATVEILPKEELALMAETLVNLTSIKRRISPESETVGGPIDVAVISKGDGFIWIKRKYYFNQQLNAHFLTNYFREE